MVDIEEMQYTFNDIIARNIQIDKLSKNDYLEMINTLIDNYKSLLANKNNEIYISQISDLNSQINILKKELLDSRNNYGTLAKKLSNPLSIKERLNGKLDLVKLTRIS